MWAAKCYAIRIIGFCTDYGLLINPVFKYILCARENIVLGTVSRDGVNDLHFDGTKLFVNITEQLS